MGRHLDRHALTMARPFSQGGMPHRGSGKAKPGRDRKGNRMEASAVVEGSAEESQEGEPVAEKVPENSPPEADWDLAGPSSGGDDGPSSGRLPKPRGSRKRPVRSPSFHSRGGVGDFGKAPANANALVSPLLAALVPNLLCKFSIFLLFLFGRCNRGANEKEKGSAFIVVV